MTNCKLSITQSHLSICESSLSLLDATQTQNEIQSGVGEFSVLDLMSVFGLMCILGFSIFSVTQKNFSTGKTVRMQKLTYWISEVVMAQWSPFFNLQIK